MVIYKSLATSFLVNFGQTRTGYTVSYQLLNSNGTVNVAWTTSGVVELGYGAYGVVLTVASEGNYFLQWKAEKTAQTTLYTAESITVLRNIISDITTIFKLQTGRWKIINDQMLFYDTDGTTPLYTFNLLDTHGNPTSTNAAERVEA